MQIIKDFQYFQEIHILHTCTPPARSLLYVKLWVLDVFVHDLKQLRDVRNYPEDIELQFSELCNMTQFLAGHVKMVIHKYYGN